MFPLFILKTLCARKVLGFTVFLLLLFSFIASAADTDYWALNFTTSKKYQYHYRQSFNKGWRFYRGDVTGAQAPGYNDASWAVVTIPHSVSYDAPEATNFYLGVAWYRKKFALPASLPATKKVFVEFEGAMSTAQIWVNGTPVGTHDNSGYTGFVFDISSQVSRIDSNIIAVRVNNSWQADVPPGDGTIDYIVYGGIYRDAWLHISDQVYVPLWGQIISTPTVTASSATVNVTTTVANDKAQQSSCSVTYQVFNGNGDQVSTQTAQQAIPANGKYTFAMSSSIPSPALWSPPSPNLYKIVTMVSVDGQPVDDYVDRFGVRTIVWSRDSGFILNGRRMEISGVNLHQDFAWVQSAVPVSRHYKIVEFIKDAGFNTMRCSHYPRSPSFYDACDELGLLLFTETPSWGWSHSSYSAAFWNRALAAFKEMILQGNNHPSIIAYGYFNEPYVDFGTYFSQMKKIADSINPALRKYCGVNPDGIKYAGNIAHVDVCGYQYINPPANIPVVCTEYLAMGNTRGDAAAEARVADTAWKAFQVIRSDGPRSAGGVLWCFKDYLGAMWGVSNQHLGIVDFCFVPKQGYYLFRKNLTGKADDNPITGTATKVNLEPDLTYLRADGTDISRIIIAIRDNNGKCITSTASVTLSLSGSSCTLFGPTTVNMIAGKLGIVVKSTETVGPTTITARSNGLADGSVAITTYPAVDYTSVIRAPHASNPYAVSQAVAAPRLTLMVNGMTRLPAAEGERVMMYNMQGRLVTSELYSGQARKMRHFPQGVYVVKVKNTATK
ncbi:MAG: beta galactosidase jelly roll domain-containing protein [Chitinispirillaceae bacterium]|nr:beta galactosidase jelly roll domain-containing protein [Chitinispirillaceae bacterium]